MKYNHTTNSFDLDDTDRELLGTSAESFPMEHWCILRQEVTEIEAKALTGTFVKGSSVSSASRVNDCMNFIWAKIVTSEMVGNYQPDPAELDAFLSDLLNDAS